MKAGNGLIGYIMIAGVVLDQLGELPTDGLALHLSSVHESGEWSDRIHHDRGCGLDVVGVAKLDLLVAIDCCHFCHTLEVLANLVVLVQESLVLSIVVLEKPDSANAVVTKLTNHTAKVFLSDLLDVVLHRLDFESTRGRGHQKQQWEHNKVPGQSGNHVGDWERLLGKMVGKANQQNGA